MPHPTKALQLDKRKFINESWKGFSVINGTPSFTEIKELPHSDAACSQSAVFSLPAPSILFGRMALKAKHKRTSWCSPVSPVLINSAQKISSLLPDRTPYLSCSSFFLLFVCSVSHFRLLNVISLRLGLPSMSLHNAVLTDTELGWTFKEENQAISNLVLIQSCSPILIQKCNIMKK